MAYREYGGDYPTVQTNKTHDSAGSEPIKVKASDIMSTKLICTHADSPVMDAVKQLEKNRISGMPVVDDNGCLTGIISEKDTFKLMLQGKFTQALAGKVGDYMSEDVETVHPDDDLFKIANLFYSKSFRRLPVIEDRKVVGLISRRDVLRSLNSMGN